MRIVRNSTAGAGRDVGAGLALGGVALHLLDSLATPGWPGSTGQLITALIWAGEEPAALLRVAGGWDVEGCGGTPDFGTIPISVMKRDPAFLLSRRLAIP